MIYIRNAIVMREESMKTFFKKRVACAVLLSLFVPVLLSPVTGVDGEDIIRKASLNGDVAGINLILPSNAVVGQPVEAILNVMDSNGRITRRSLEGISFSSTDGAADLSKMPAEVSSVRAEKNAVTFNTPGIHYVIAENKERTIRAVSNPVRVTETEQKYKLYWGELHAQTWFSDGWYTTVCTSPDDAYRYYRYVAGLDFAAVTDHDCCWEGVVQTPFGVIGNWYTDEFMKRYGWEKEKDAVKNNYEEGEFVTLLAQEWTQDSEAYNTYHDGHYNIYYNCVDEAEFYSCLDDPTNRVYKMFQILEEWKEDSGKDVFMIPHHLQHPTLGWDYHYYDENLVPLIEICQSRGSSEMRNDLGNPLPFSGAMTEPGHTVQDALAMGYMMGFVAGTDDHGIGETPEHLLCLTGVMAENLTRESVFNALKDRRCIAVSGGNTRMIIDLTVNGQTAGGGSVVKITNASSPRKIECIVAGTAPLSSVALVKNNQTIFSTKIDGNAQDLSTYKTEFSFTDTEPVSGVLWRDEYSGFERGTEGKDYYYVRVVQSDGSAGWISPIWVEAEKA